MKKQLIGGVLLLMVSTFALAQQNFTTPGQATDALTKAISEQNEEALNSLLGDNWRDYLPPEGVDPEAVARFLRDWKVSHHVAINGDTAHLYVGENGWQLPIPVVKKTDGWQFDMQKAADEIQTREIGRNELAAIEALHAYVDAQQSYFALNQHYAEKIVSAEGKKMVCTGPSHRAKRPARSDRHLARKSLAPVITAIVSGSCPISLALR